MNNDYRAFPECQHLEAGRKCCLDAGHNDECPFLVPGTELGRDAEDPKKYPVGQ